MFGMSVLLRDNYIETILGIYAVLPRSNTGMPTYLGTLVVCKVPLVCIRCTCRAKALDRVHDQAMDQSTTAFLHSN